MLTDDGPELRAPLGLDEGSFTALSLGAMLNDVGPALGIELGEAVGRSIGPLLGTIIVDVDGAADSLPLGLNDVTEIGLLVSSELTDGTELGVELVETT